MSDHDLLYDVDDLVATITINRPAKLNALRQQTFRELTAAIDRAERDETVKVIVLTGSGTKAFCTGIDLEADGLPADSIEWDAHTRGNADAISRLWYAAKPVITAVNGFALAGGCNVALASDLTIAAASASFGEPEIRHGALSPLLLLPWLTSFKGFNELYLTGDRISAARAKELGLVNWVVDDADLASEAARIARRIANAPGYALTLAKRAVRLTMDIQGFHSAQSAHRWIDTYLLDSRGVTEKDAIMKTLGDHGMGAFLDARDAPYGDR
ncbi:enoyl-CoA hydratase/isomerase family protein [Herbiconiux moechotypicola]|uniref:Enoyl-CoA hydratase-related protein n=1 Tax=Herbiconiux moechotypicola TaxID=637393 RepID=A0ABN3DEI5_9MICO|nr:enoyl-CoA hydratase/isomerase family protein [Herbiconiux moechotypicola]MCS5729286.1 enoyl-CoA hydratase/isomerase family protein [Herbiconiux moechotypicola]